MWPFRRKPVLDPDTAAWHVENFAWLMRQFGGDGAFARTQLVLPKPGFFLSEGEQGHALACRIFVQVQRYCGMLDWEVDLVQDRNPLAEPPDLASAMIAPRKHKLGTFAINGNAVQISYASALLRQPDRLIATFAHELSHYLLATAGDRPLCADDEFECLTDLTAVFLGFGVFLANARFVVQTAEDGVWHGWQMRRAGYLPEADLIYALALFLCAKGLAAEEACVYLKPHLAGLLRRAMRDLAADDAALADIRAALAERDAGRIGEV